MAGGWTRQLHKLISPLAASPRAMLISHPEFRSNSLSLVLLSDYSDAYGVCSLHIRRAGLSLQLAGIAVGGCCGF